MGSFVEPIRRIDTAKGHHYKDGAGQKVPGVTTIIGGGLPKPALLDWAANATAEYAVDRWDELSGLPPAKLLKQLKGARYEDRDAAARRGTEVHRAAEQLMAGETVQVPDAIAGHVEAYVRFMDDFNVRPLHVEFGCISYRWGYAGTADLCARLTIPGKGRATFLIDLKTTRSGIFGDIALQLAAYRHAERWLMPGNKEVTPVKVDYCAGLHIRGDGYDLIPVEAEEQQHKQFLYVKQVKGFVDGSRDLVGAPIIPPTTSNFRLTREAE
jgi:hypothetical protein